MMRLSRRARGSIVALCWMGALGACAGASEAPTATATPSHTAPTTNASGVRVSAPACGYGGSAPAVSVFIDVDSSIPLTHVTASFTLGDVNGVARGGASEPSQLVVSPTERGLLDFSTQGTSPFDGSIPANAPTRLQYFAGLSANDVDVAPAPLRIDVVVRSDQGTYSASCALGDMWPSS
jgi:hypothetical protein